MKIMLSEQSADATVSQIITANAHVQTDTQTQQRHTKDPKETQRTPIPNILIRHKQNTQNLIQKDTKETHRRHTTHTKDAYLQTTYQPYS